MLPFASSPQGAPEPIQRFNKLRELGKGAQGFVHLCEDTRNGNARVAVKYINRGKTSKIYKYVVREVLNHQELSSYRHPHIVEFHEVFLTPKYLGVVMEYGGMDMGAYLNQNHGRLQEEIARFCFQQLILALEFCHRCGKGHRDIKLGNILVLLDGRIPIVKLCDFGFCKDQHLDSAAVSEIGTALYAAPEVVHVSPLWSETGYNAQQADVWSCGIVLFVLLFGIHPFVPQEQLSSGRSCIMIVVENSIKGNLLLPEGAARQMPEAIDLIRKILVPEPSQRCSVNDIIQHPWFQSKLPSEMKNKFGSNPDGAPRQYRQHPDITASLIEAAAGSNPDGPLERLQTQPREMSMKEQAAMVQQMLLAERQQQQLQQQMQDDMQQ